MACTMAAYSAIVALRSAKKILAKLEEFKERTLYEEIEMPLVYTLYDMQRAGILVDKQALVDYGVELRAGI